MAVVTMPRLSDTMEEGTLLRWLKQVGDPVARGDVLAEIETDKAVMELESYDAGVLEDILVGEGQTVPIGEPIAMVGSGEGAKAAPSAGSAGGGAAAAPAAAPPAPAPAAAASAVPPKAEVPVDKAPAGATAPADDEGKVRASPMARALARDRGVDLRSVTGSGPGGRIVKADVLAAGDGGGASPAAAPAPAAAAAPAAAPAPTAAPAAPAAPAPPEAPAAATVGRAPAAAGPAAAPAAAPAAPAPPAAAGGEDEEIPLTSMRKTVARRLTESMQQAPHFYLTNEIDAEELQQFRTGVNAQLAAAGADVKVTVTDLLVKACAVALRDHPDANASWGGDRILRHRRVHVGIAVALETGGLLVPVVRDADQKSVTQIAREAKVLAEKARSGRVTLDDITGGTFTVSNLGMYGIDHFTAVINPPEAAILAVGATIPRVVARGGEAVVRPIMTVTLSIDHRVLDGAVAARFLQRLKQIIEAPLLIVT